MSDQKFFEDCRSMFMMDGWKAFQDELMIAIQSIQVGAIESSDEFWKAKGRWEALSQIIGWESAVKAAEEQAEEDDASDY